MNKHDQSSEHDQAERQSQQAKPPASQKATNDSEGNLQALQAKFAELTEALQRERADATNLRRHHDEDMLQVRARTKAHVVRDLLPVIDNFDRSLKHVPEDLQGNEYVKGVQGVVKQFEKTLQDMDVERIKTVGEAFDPRYHEAVSVEEGEGDEVIIEELQSGYRVGEDIIRHAMVKVRA